MGVFLWIWWVAYGLFVSFIMTSYAQNFIENPSFEVFERCRKDELIVIADHFRISVRQQLLKREIKDFLLHRLVEMDILVLSETEGEAVQIADGAQNTKAGEEVVKLAGTETEVEARAALPPFEPFSPATPGSLGESKLKIRLARLRMEAEERAQTRQGEFDLRLKIRRLEIDAEKEVNLRRLEMEGRKLAPVTAGPVTSNSVSKDTAARGIASAAFDVTKNLPLVPLFRESEVDSYFGAFERIAVSLGWPKDVWALLLQCRLSGKALEVFSALSLADSLQYETVKTAILRSFELVPEAYRQKFRNHKKSVNQAFVEFAREKGVLFDKWCVSSKVTDFSSLRELMLLEDFKKCLPERIVLYLNEQKVTDLATAAVSADEFALTHKNVFFSARTERNAAGVQPQLVPSQGKPANEQARMANEQSKERRECYYCHKAGHVIADCLVLKRKQQSSPQQKPVAFVSTVSEDLTEVLPDGIYKPFLLRGFVSFSGRLEEQVEIKILRDTGAAYSFICADALPFSDQSHLGSSILVQGFCMEVVKVPLHRIHVKSDLVTGFVNVGVRAALPVPGVSFILGNDLAGGRVLPALEVVDNPIVTPESDELAQTYPELFSACVLTRAQIKKKDDEVVLNDTFFCVADESGEVTAQDDPVNKDSEVAKVNVLLPLSVTRTEVVEAQKTDETLSKCFIAARDGKNRGASYIIDEGLLVRKWQPTTSASDEGTSVYQVVIPFVYRPHVLSLAHDHVLSGHLGVTKTYGRILQHFFWPGLKKDVANFCRTCHTCQYMGKPNQVIPPAPLVPIPALGEPFERVIVDCVGPLPKTKSGNQFVLTIMCSATRYPEAIPLRTITAKAVIKSLIKFFSTFGLPKFVQTDQGTNFLSKLFKQVLSSLNIKHCVSSSYHPESQGALERFHQTLKSMLKKYCVETGNEWDEGIPFVLFAIRETVQESLRFSPADLVFGHSVRGPLKVLKEQMLGIGCDLSPKVNVLDYVCRLRERVQKACDLARDFLSQAQSKMKKRFDEKTVLRVFSVGDRVLVLLPIPGSALSARFAGPYEIVGKKSETDYVLKTPDRKRQQRVCHINMLKTYHSRDDVLVKGPTEEIAGPAISPVAVNCPVDASSVGVLTDEDGLMLRSDPLSCVRLSNSEVLSDLSKFLVGLTESQKQDVTALIRGFPAICGDVPTQTRVLYHDINVKDAHPIKQHPYRVNATKRSLMRDEVDYLVREGLAEPSSSPWSSPCLLVPKSDGNYRFCTDYRKINAVTVPDCFPLPRMEDCIDNLGSAQFVSKLDLLKGYWQVPLTPRASEISAFVTPDSFMQYRVMAFGLRNAPATFQRLVNTVLAGVSNCSAYLDDLVVYSMSWSEHLSLLGTVFQRLETASLTLNLAKCEIGKATITYLGKQVGQGQVRPVEAKIAAILEFPAPSTRRELRRFIGMAGYYRNFCRNFSTVARPLTDLLSPSKSFGWSLESQQAFENIKALLCSTPVLSAPNFAVPFTLEVDASAYGTGAVLLQENADGVDHPICYFSKKFNKHQVNYSTIEKEALALLLALQNFEVYVGSTAYPVIVFTDHNPLTFLCRMYNQNQRLMRWALIVQNYNLEIRHKRGSENVVADALSRV